MDALEYFILHSEEKLLGQWFALVETVSGFPKRFLIKNSKQYSTRIQYLLSILVNTQNCEPFYFYPLYYSMRCMAHCDFNL